AAMERAAVPEFVSVTGIGVAGVPTFTAPKATLAGEKVTAGVGALEPIPVIGTVCVAGVALSANVSVAFSVVPLVDGVNVSTTVQVPPVAATGVATTQVLVGSIAKSPAFVPESAGAAENINGRLPVFVRVTVIGELVCP